MLDIFRDKNFLPVFPRQIRYFQKPLGLIIQMALAKRFGSFAIRQHFDLISRPQYAYGMLRAAMLAKKLGKQSTTVYEFGVWNGDGLAKMVKIAGGITKEYGIHFNIIGFESGEGRSGPVSLNTSSPFDKWIAPSVELSRSGLRL